MVRRIVMVIMVVMANWLFASRVAAQDGGCLATVNYLSQATAQSLAAAYTDAFDSFTCALETDPSNTDARIGRLQAALLAGDFLTAYGDALLLNDGSFQVLDSAIADQTAILAVHSDSVSAYQIRAFLYLFSGQPNMARTDAESILNLASNNSLAHFIQAASSEMTGDTEGAARAFQTAVDQAPDSAQLYGLMAAAQWASFNIDGMAANSSRAIELAPQLAHAYYLHGMSQLLMGNPEEARADANRAIDLDSTYYAFYILRANVRMALDAPQAAFADLNTAIGLNPWTIKGHSLRSQVALALGQVPSARQDFATAIEWSTLETVEGVVLTADDPVILTMTPGRTYRVSFQGWVGQVASIRAARITPDDVDPLVQVVAPSGTLLGFNDDASDVTLDAALSGIELREDGLYTLVLSRANAGRDGNIELSLDLRWRRGSHR